MSASVPADVLKNFRSKARCLCNIWIKEIYDEKNNLIDPDSCNKIVVADLPIGFFDFLKSARVSPLMGAIFNPFYGLDIMMTRTGSGRNNTEYKYGTRPGMVPGPLVNDLDKVQKILTDVKDLATLVAENCKRDLDTAKEVAGHLRTYLTEMSKRASFGTLGAAAPGFGPGPMPGGFVPTMPIPQAAPANPWGVPAAPAAPQGWPQQPQNQQSPQGWPAAPAQPQAPQGWPQQPQQAPASFAPPAASATPPWAAPQAQASVQSAPAAPVQNPAAPAAAPSMPSCYRQFRVKNGMDPAMESNPKDEQCKTCVYRAACIFESPSV